MLVKSMFNAGPFDIAREMDRLFESMIAAQPLSMQTAPRGRWSFPAVNLSEDETRFHIEAELPGMTLDDLELLATDDELTIKGTRDIPVPEGWRPLRRERGVGSFERTIGLPTPVEVSEITAEFRDGVLRITLPKAKAAVPRRIEVRTS